MRFEVIYQSITKVVTLKIEEAMKGDISKEEAEFWTSLKKVLTLLELRSCPSQSLLNISHHSIDMLVDYEKQCWSKNHGKFVDSALSENLVKTCLKLTEFYDGADYKDRQSVNRTRALHLHEVIRKDCDESALVCELLDGRRREAVEYFFHTLQTIIACSEAVEEMMDKYQMSLQPKKDDIELKSIHTHLQTILLKAKSVRQELMAETYTRDNVKCLRLIREDLTRRINSCNSELRAAHDKLYAYELLGDEFRLIVDEYRQTTEKLKKQKWMLGQMEEKTGGCRT